MNGCCYREESSSGEMFLFPVSPQPARPSPLCQTSPVRTCPPDSPATSATRHAWLKHKDDQRKIIYALDCNFTFCFVSHSIACLLLFCSVLVLSLFFVSLLSL